VGCADAPSTEEGSEEASRAVDVVHLISAVLEESPHNRQSMIQISGLDFADNTAVGVQ
jgi:hypothetical protein